MKKLWALYKKEVSDKFRSPMVYVLAALFSGLLGLMFYNYIVGLKSMPEGGNLKAHVIFPLFGNANFIFLFMGPLLAMDSFAGERKNDTLQILMLSRLKAWQIIAAKYFGIVTVIFFFLTMTLIFPITLVVSGFHDWSMFIGIYLGVFLCAMAYAAVGVFTSSLTENPVIAAVSGFSILLASMLFLSLASGTDNYILSQIVRYLSVPFHFETFARGVVRNYNVVFFLSIPAWFLYSSKKAVEIKEG